MGKKEMTVRTEADFQARVAEWSEADRTAQLDRKNINFFMMFREHGSPAVRRMIELNGIAARTFLFIAEKMDRSNAIVASGKAQAAALGVSEPSMSRALKTLDEEGYIARFKSGGSNVIVANPDLVWSSWATGKDLCLFSNAKVLLSKSEQDTTLVRKFTHIVPKLTEEELSTSAKTPVERARKKVSGTKAAPAAKKTGKAKSSHK